jgi:hypothetical protein
MNNFSKGERLFLQLSYEAFYEIFNEVFTERFWEQNSEYRFNKIKNAICIYAELLNYKPLKAVSTSIASVQGKVGSLLVNDMFTVIRHLLSHFPFFSTWDEVYFSKTLVTWERSGQIHRFFEKHNGGESVQYAYREKTKNEDTHVIISLPSHYSNDETIYLKDIIPEENGMKFCINKMSEVLSSQFGYITVKALINKGK